MLPLCFLPEPELTMNRIVYVYNCSKGRSRIVSKDQGNIRDVLLDKTMRCHRCVPYSSTEPDRPVIYYHLENLVSFVTRQYKSLHYLRLLPPPFIF